MEIPAVVRAIQDGDLEGLKAALRESPSARVQALQAHYAAGGVEGSILHVAVYYDHHHIVSYVFEEVGQLYGSMREGVCPREQGLLAVFSGSKVVCGASSTPFPAVRQ